MVEAVTVWVIRRGAYVPAQIYGDCVYDSPSAARAALSEMTSRGDWAIESWPVKTAEDVVGKTRAPRLKEG